VAAHPAAEPTGLEQDDIDARLGEQERRRQADDPTADHDYIGPHVPFQAGQRWLLGTGIDPDRLGFHPSPLPAQAGVNAGAEDWLERMLPQLGVERVAGAEVRS
jgi:hypothetical protein